jgi:DnaK suppressor protein
MDIATARKRLEEIRGELDKSIMVLRGDERDEKAGDFPQDPADAGANLSESERTGALLSVAREQLAQVLSALERIANGSYGTCVDCGAKVPDGRLEAKPEAARCVACQARYDRSRR